jgi:hypothetical protein
MSRWMETCFAPPTSFEVRSVIYSARDRTLRPYLVHGSWQVQSREPELLPDKVGTPAHLVKAAKTRNEISRLSVNADRVIDDVRCTRVGRMKQVSRTLLSRSRSEAHRQALGANRLGEPSPLNQRRGQQFTSNKQPYHQQQSHDLRSQSASQRSFDQQQAMRLPQAVSRSTPHRSATFLCNLFPS